MAAPPAGTPNYDGDLASVPPAQSGARRARPGLGARLSLGRAVVGHDFGSPVAAWCALVRPDVFRSVVLMSAPFAGPPPLPSIPPTRQRRRSRRIPCIASSRRCRGRASIINGTTRRARPMPTCTARRRACTISCAPTTITRARTGQTTRPIRCKAGPRQELAKLPTYYVMDLDKNMAETVAREMPSAAAIAANHWLPGRELAFYSAEYERTGFQGGLQWYRCGTSGAFTAELADCFPAAPSTCPPASSPASRTGAPISAPACSRRCRRRACTRHARLSSGRRRRPLGAAGTARGSEPAAAAFLRERANTD